MGAPQAGSATSSPTAGEGYGFLIETAQYAPGLIGSARPWISAADHKQRMEQFRCHRRLHRPHPGPWPRRGRGGRQRRGDPPPTRSPMSSTCDNLRRGIEVQIRLHEAAGAHQIYPLAAGAPTWRRGEDLGASSRSPTDPLPRRRPQALQRPPDGDLPDGDRPRDLGRRPSWRAPRRQGCLDRGRQRLPDLVGDQPDGLDHGAGAGTAVAIAEDAGAAAAAQTAPTKTGAVSTEAAQPA